MATDSNLHTRLQRLLETGRRGTRRKRQREREVVRRVQLRGKTMNVVDAERDGRVPVTVAFLGK